MKLTVQDFYIGSLMMKNEEYTLGGFMTIKKKILIFPVMLTIFLSCMSMLVPVSSTLSGTKADMDGILGIVWNHRTAM